MIARIIRNLRSAWKHRRCKTNGSITTDIYCIGPCRITISKGRAL